MVLGNEVSAVSDPLLAMLLRMRGFGECQELNDNNRMTGVEAA
jgi:hypothetical protein